MPTYEYRCESCGRSFDVVQSFHDTPLTVCDVCAGALRKVFAPVGIVFKGSGFYKNDSRTSSRSTVAAQKDATTASSAESSSESTSASSPASTTSSGEGAASGAPATPVATKDKDSGPKSPPPTAAAKTS